MRIPIFGHAKRPQADTQNTGRDVYERPFGVANVTVNGVGGFSNHRSLSPISPPSENLAFLATVSITGVGNETNTNPNLEPIIDKRNNGGNQQF